MGFCRSEIGSATVYFIFIILLLAHRRRLSTRVNNLVQYIYLSEHISLKASGGSALNLAPT